MRKNHCAQQYFQILPDITARRSVQISQCKCSAPHSDRVLDKIGISIKFASVKYAAVASLRKSRGQCVDGTITIFITRLTKVWLYDESMDVLGEECQKVHLLSGTGVP